ncbi:hypothetical protein CMO90_01050, partial [Candidatus Woesearchaeota archaeon]|nr:hypothetical protein [Candidatus Woesearchaeota archaeon]
LAEAKEKLAEAEEATEAEEKLAKAEEKLAKAENEVIDDFKKQKFSKSQKDYDLVQETKKTLEDQNMDVEEIEKEGEESVDYIKIEERRTIAIKKAKEERINAGVDIASRFFYEYVIKNYLTLRSFAPHTALGQLQSWLDSNLNSDALKNNLCYPDSNIWFGGAGAHAGVVHDCEGNSCPVVLTFGGEKIFYNDSGSLYSIVYLIGGLQEDVTYNVYMKKENGEKVYVFNSKITLVAGDNDNFARAWVSSKDYEEMCLEFDELFPPNLGFGQAKKTFCRAVKEDTYRTGAPAIVTENGYTVSGDDAGWNANI